MNLIENTKHVAAAYKPNAAFFEALGAEGVAALERVVRAIPSEVPVILDVKRGDISTTAEAYAESAFLAMKCDAVTVNPYMGFDAVEPFVKFAGGSKGVFLLCKTSNASSEDFETLELKSGERLYERIAKKTVEWDSATHNLGLVVGATDAKSMRAVREVAPEVWILAPGIGFQGGDLNETVAAGLRKSDGHGLLVPVSRGISRAPDQKEAADRLRTQLSEARRRFTKTVTTSQPSSPNKRSKHVTSGEEEAPAGALDEYQSRFFDLALASKVLTFGDFTLKSGRKSPYFFNAGLFFSGSAAHRLAECYADRIHASGIQFDVMFGPAYKGITLAATTAAALYSRHGRDVEYGYNRKGEKDHGEGGRF